MPSSNRIYHRINFQVKKWSELIISSPIKMSLPLVMFPCLIISYFTYFTSKGSQDNDAFQLAFPIWYRNGSVLSALEAFHVIVKLLKRCVWTLERFVFFFMLFISRLRKKCWIFYRVEVILGISQCRFIYPRGFLLAIDTVNCNTIAHAVDAWCVLHK